MLWLYRGMHRCRLPYFRTFWTGDCLHIIHFMHGILQEEHILVFKSLSDGWIFFKLSDNRENALYTGFPQKHTKGIKGPM